jgi:hypothetical protein
VAPFDRGRKNQNERNAKEWRSLIAQEARFRAIFQWIRRFIRLMSRGIPLRSRILRDNDKNRIPRFSLEIMIE